jgi:integrase
MSVNSNRFSLFKRSNQVYYVGYYQNGRRKWKSTRATVKAEALKALTQFKELLQERARSVPLQEFVAEFLAYGEGNYSRKTMAMYEPILARFLSLARNASLRELTPQHIDRYKARRLRDKTKSKHPREISPVSVNVELRMLKAAFNKARSWKLIDSHLFDGVTLAELPECTPPFFTRADFHKLLECVKEGWLKDVIVFAVLTGMRRGEIMNLKWSDVDLLNKYVRVETSKTFKTKQGKRRIVPLNDTVISLLKAKEGKSPSEYVFTLNDEKLYEDWVGHLFKSYVIKAKLNGRLHFHSLRHTFASWLVQDGVSLYEVQKLLGHSSSSVTEVYSHLQPEQMHGTVNRIHLMLN